MSLFYLLPPRPLLGDRFAGFLQALFPGLDWAVAERTALAELIGSAVAAREDVHVVYRDDLPEGETAARALADGYGAEEGDEVIEVRPGGRPGEWASRRWRVGL